MDAAVTVERYLYEFDLEKAHATSTVTGRVGPDGGNCFELDCALSPTTTQLSDEPCFVSTLSDERLRVCGPTHPADSDFELRTTLDVPEQTFLGLDVGFSRKSSQQGGTFAYLLSWFGGCSHFGPCDRDPGHLTGFEIAVSHPVGTTVLCPGTLQAGVDLTRCTIDAPLAPTYSAFALAAHTAWKRSHFANAAGVDIVFYEGAGSPLASHLASSAVVAAFEWLSELLGPYPWGNELRFAAAPTAWLGFEHPANIILHERLPTLSLPYADGTLHVLVHETVHQWAGAYVTPATELDFVWKEAIAEYLTYVFEEEYLGEHEASASRAYWDSISRWADFHPRPTDDPAPSIADFYGDAYGPGPLVLFIQLEPLLGRDTLLAAIQSFVATPGGRSVADLKLVMEQVSGEDLGPYFDAWVFGKGKPAWPRFIAETEQVGSEVTITLTQQSGSSKIYGCAVEVRVDGATSSATGLVNFGLSPTSPTASVVVTLDEPIVGVVVDPDFRVIDLPASRSVLGARPHVWMF
jgi:aminopeptidase N